MLAIVISEPRSAPIVTKVWATAGRMPVITQVAPSSSAPRASLRN